MLERGVSTANVADTLADCGRSHWTGAVVRYHCFPASEALSLCQQLDDPRGIAWSLEVLAGILSAEGRAEDAARLCGASDSLLEVGGGLLPPTIGWIRDHYVSRARQSLGDDSFSKARAEGRGMPIEEVIRLAQRP